MIEGVLGLAPLFSTIVQHISAFSTGRAIEKTATLVEFYGELADAGRQDIIEQIENNQKTLISTKALLNRHFQGSEEEIVNALTKLNQASEENLTKLFDRLTEQNDEQFCVLLHQIHSSVEELGSPSNEKLDNVLTELNKSSVELFPQMIRQLTSITKQLTNQNDSINQVIEKLGEAYRKIEQLSTPPVIPKALTLAIPRLHAKKLIGRDRELKALRDLLCREENVALVNGMGGIGKTALAQAYLSRYWEDYQHIAWLSQESDHFPSDVIAKAELFDNLGVDKSGDSEVLFNGLMNGMNRIENRPNLLVIDDARESLEQWIEVLPKHDQWHILLTSRCEIYGFERLPLDFLSPSSAVELFRQHYKREILSADSIAGLVATVDYHTLTVELLAKVAQYRRTPVDELLQALKQDLPAGVVVNHQQENKKVDRIRSYLTTIFSADTFNDAERWLLTQFLCLPPDFHPFEMLSELINVEASGYANQFSALLIDLKSRGWLIENAETDSYKMHQVIQVALAPQLGVSFETVKPLVERITQTLSIDQTKDNPVDKFPWIPFGKKLLELFEQNEPSELPSLQNNLASVLKALGDYEGAKTLLEKAMASDEQNFGEMHPNTAVCYSNLALVLKALGDYEGAKTLLEKAMVSAEQNFGEAHPSTAVRYSNLATVLQDLGDYEGAKTLLEKAMASDEQNFGETHPTTAVRYSNLALVLKALGDYEGALILLEKTIEIMNETFSPDHPYVERAKNNYQIVATELENGD